MGNTELAIVAAEAKAKLEGITGLGDRLIAAMKAAKGHWLVLDKDVQLRGAIAAVLMVLEEEGNTEDSERIKKELGTLQALSAATSGVPVNFAALDLPANPVGLLKLWHEIQDG